MKSQHKLRVVPWLDYHDVPWAFMVMDAVGHTHAVVPSEHEALAVVAMCREEEVSVAEALAIKTISRERKVPLAEAVQIFRSSYAEVATKTETEEAVS